MSLRTFAAATTAALLLLASPALAQTLTVNPDPLVEGGTATIEYNNPALAGTIVTIHIDNGMRHNPVTTTVEIVLGADGSGTASWSVPKWYVANFNAPSVPEVGRLIVSGATAAEADFLVGD